MGLFTCFESGGRTDSVIQHASRTAWAKVEREWQQPKQETVNEIQKLADASEQADVSIFIGYSKSEHHAENLAKILETWKGVNKPLIAILVTHSFHGRRRHFDYLQSHYIKNTRHVKVRRQPALPWHVKGTKWAALSTSASITPAPPDNGE